MTLPFNKLFNQRDVRETPVSTATATAVGLTDGKYLVTDYHTDMTDERKVTAGEGIDFTDGGANSTFLIACELASTTNKGAASFNTQNFTTSSGAVSLKLDDTPVNGETDEPITSNWAFDHDANTDAHHAQSHNAASHSDITATGAQLDAAHAHVSADGSSHSLLANKTSYWSCSGNNFDVDSSTQPYIKSGNFNMGAGAGAAVANVELPNGAVVTGAIVYGNDAVETWTLIRKTLSGGATANMANEDVNSEDTSIDNATIDNSTYAYYFHTSVLDTADLIYGARIKYTTDYD